jgi:hypothetical protein
LHLHQLNKLIENRLQLCYLYVSKILQNAKVRLDGNSVDRIRLCYCCFGGKKIPELMRGLGRGVREFKEGKDNVRKDLEESTPEKKSK